MKLLLLSELRFVRHAPWSAASALLGIALGVASVVAVHLIGVRVEQSLATTVPPHLDAVTHVIEEADRRGVDADAYFDLRARWRARHDSAVEALVPLVEGQAAGGDAMLRVIGIDWLADWPGQMEPGLPAAGLTTFNPDLLSGVAVLADRGLGLAAGEEIRVGGRTVAVAGLVEGGDSTIYADIALAQALLGLAPDRLSAVALRLRDPWFRWRTALDGLMPGLSAGLPPVQGVADDPLFAAGPSHTAEADRWRILDLNTQRPSAAFARSVLFNLGALGTLALLVSWFLVHQVAVIWLRRQRLLLQRLHVLGVPERTLRLAFLGLIGALGLVATVAGTLLGMALAARLVAMTAAGSGLPPALAAGVDGWVVVKAAAAGVGGCLLAGYLAFGQALADAQTLTGRRTRAGARALVAVVLVGVMAGGLLWQATGLIGGFAAILAMCLLAVLLVPLLLRAVRVAAAGSAISWPLRLAWRDVSLNPHLLAVAVAALALAVATSLGVGVMVASFRADFDRMLAVRLAGDVYLYDTVADQEALRVWLDGQDNVRVVPFGEQPARIEGLPVSVGYARFDAEQAARYGLSRPLAAGEALVNERLARDLNVAVGDRVAGLAVAGTFPGFGDAAGRMMLDVASLERLGLAPVFDRLMLSTPEPEALAAAVAARFPAVRVESRVGLRARALSLFDRTFAITRALTGVALIVAVVGTYNALTALRLQQQGTVQLLEAQGAAAGQIRRIGLLRAGTLGALAVVLALPLGIAMAWTLCTVVNPRSFGWQVALELPLSAWLNPLLLGLGAALAAGVLPAPRERSYEHAPA